MSRKNRPWLFYDTTVFGSNHLPAPGRAGQVTGGDEVFDKGARPTVERVLIADDADYYRLCRGYVKAPEMPWNASTPPPCARLSHDCGLCPTTCSIPASRWWKSPGALQTPCCPVCAAATAGAADPSVPGRNRGHARRGGCQ